MKAGVLHGKASQESMEDLASSIEAFERLTGTVIHKSSVGAEYHFHPENLTIRDAARHLLGWFWRSGLDKEFLRQTGHQPVLLANYTTIRRHNAGDPSTHVQWHFDANFVGLGGSFLVFWVPLDPVGEDAPGLDFYLPQSRFRLKDLAEKLSKVEKTKGRHVIMDEELGAFFDGQPAKRTSPILRPGDVLYFDQHVLHRTQRLERVTRTRTAIEFRVGAAEAPVPGHSMFDPDVAAVLGDDNEPAMTTFAQAVADYNALRHT